jgi:DNA-binding NtrC family response regulator
VLRDMSYSSGPVYRSTMLLIDDDPIIRENLRRLFSISYECEVSDGAIDVLGKLDQRKYDVVITDVSMPGVDGLQILKRIHARHRETPIIVISGNGDQFKDLFLEMGAFAYISKPFRFDELESAVLAATAAINRRRQ